MKRFFKNLGETFKTIGELFAFLTRRGQWWLMPVIVLGLLVGLGLAAGQMGVFGWIYVIF